jgi:glycerol kinase
VVGLTRGVSKDHFVRATVESLAYQTNDLIGAMREDSGLAITSLKVDGGASANNFLMQFQSDISDVKIERPKCVETTALGAAYLAGLAVGYWKDLDDVRTNWQMEREFTPSVSPEKRAKLLKGWRRAVKCAIYWAREECDDE